MRKAGEVIVVIAPYMPADMWNIIVRRGPDAEKVRWIAPGATKLEIWFKELKKPPKGAKRLLKLETRPLVGRARLEARSWFLPGLCDEAGKSGATPSCELPLKYFPMKNKGDCVAYGFRATYPNGSELSADPVVIWQP